MWTWNFWKQVAERAIKTGVQTVAALITVTGVGILDVNWAQIGNIAAFAMVSSLITSIATSGVGQSGSPSAVRTETPAKVSPVPGDGLENQDPA